MGALYGVKAVSLRQIFGSLIFATLLGVVLTSCVPKPPPEEPPSDLPEPVETWEVPEGEPPAEG
jgi:hypothetical protein